MNLRGYKTAPPLTARWPRGGTVQLAPLGRFACTLAESASESLHLALGCTPDTPHAELTRQAFLIASSMCVEPEAVLDALSPRELAELYQRWDSWQVEVAVAPASLVEEIRKRINDSVDVMLDGQLAHLAESPADYYGHPLAELTDAQVLYWRAARSAFQEFFVDGNEKEVSREWLQSKSA